MEEKKFIPTYGMEKETTIFNEDGSAYRIRIELMWDREKTLDGFKQLVKVAKELLDSMVGRR